MTTINTDIHDCEIFVKNLPFGQKDREDISILLNDGLGLNITVKSVHRAPSVNNNAGIITIELSSPCDKALVMRNKYKLRQQEKYYDVYIDERNDSVHTRIEQKVKFLLNNMHSGGYLPASGVSFYNSNRRRAHVNADRNQYRNNRYHNEH